MYVFFVLLSYTNLHIVEVILKIIKNRRYVSEF